jgi:hypothetical protein
MQQMCSKDVAKKSRKIRWENQRSSEPIASKVPAVNHKIGTGEGISRAPALALRASYALMRSAVQKRLSPWTACMRILQEQKSAPAFLSNQLF